MVEKTIDNKAEEKDSEINNNKEKIYVLYSFLYK